jgi:hypothetical protein
MKDLSWKAVLWFYVIAEFLCICAFVIHIVRRG